MNSTIQTAAPVKSERLPFRPGASLLQAAYWTNDAGRLCALLSSRRLADAYELIPLSTDIGGCAIRWFKQGGENYDVLVNGTDGSCSCAGWAYTGGCKHIQTTFYLLQLGVLQAEGGAVVEISIDHDAPAYECCRKEPWP